MKLPITGGCLCGNIRYAISAAPFRTANCHCRTCQQSVGAPFVAIMIVPKAAFAVSGEFKEFTTVAASGNRLHRAFCPNCGTALFVRNSGFPEVRPISAVTLDDPSIYRPDKDIWVSDAQPWVVMDPELPKFEGNPF